MNIAKLIDINDTKTFLNAHLVVSTPGIAVKAFKREILNPASCKVVIFDEADVLLGTTDKDHCTIIARNISKLKEVQLLGFSATTSQDLLDWFNKTFSK